MIHIASYCHLLYLTLIQLSFFDGALIFTATFAAKNWLTTCPTLVGLLRSFCLWHPEEPEVRYVDQDYISKLKLESDTKVSTNDILTSHLLQKSGFGYGYMSINLRNRGLGGQWIERWELRPSHPSGAWEIPSPWGRFGSRWQDLKTLAPPGWWESMDTATWLGIQLVTFLPRSLLVLGVWGDFFLGGWMISAIQAFWCPLSSWHLKWPFSCFFVWVEATKSTN